MPKAAVADTNALVFLYLRELASVQKLKPKAQAYRRAAAVVFGLEDQLPAIRRAQGSLPKFPGLGPSSMRVVEEVLATGRSPTADRALALAGADARVGARAELHVISRARVIDILARTGGRAVSRASYRGDLQMHSEWSDGAVPIAAMAAACAARGYEYMAVTDHAKALPIAGGLSMEAVGRQHREIDRLNAANRTFRILKGIEANIAPDGSLDVSDEDRRRFDIVLAAPHAHLRTPDDQTERLLRVVQAPGVHVLAHPRGRVIGSRSGIVADWDRIFAAAAKRKVTIELDGYAERQDLDHEMARRALNAGCLFTLDSDAHSPDQLVFAETAIAHARLAGIPPARIVNCWPLARLLNWAAGR